jgi:hypothetical protein
MPLYAPFGNAIFGETLFGVPPSVSTYTSLTVLPPIGAQGAPSPYAYTGLQVDWQPAPLGQFSGQVLVRSAYGIPTSIYDGTVLVGQLPQATPQSYTSQYLDTGLKSGQFYYYALFVFSTALGQWVVSGTAQGLCLIDWGFGSTYQTWTPDWYLEQDATLATLAQPEGPLVRFFELIGFETDWIRSEIESLILLSNVDLISGALLPYLGANYGVEYEPVLGMTRSRVLVKNAVYLYKNKGTANGIAAAASAFSGYGAEVTIGKNLEIQLDDSAFDRSTGHWVSNNATATISTVSLASLNIPGAHTSYDAAVALPAVTGYLPNNNANVAVITAGKSGGAAVTSWTQVMPPTSPLGRVDACMVYDPTNSTSYLFGGVDSTGTIDNDVWAYTGTTWKNVTPVSPAAPGIRQGAGLAYDTNTGVAILFGGGNGSSALGDTWSWNGTVWTQLTPLNSPSARLDHVMVYDAANQTIVLFGGQSSPSSGTALSDTWIWNGTNWVQQSPATSPPALYGATACYSAATTAVILNGGQSSAGWQGATWSWNGTTWTQLSPGPAGGAVGPSPRIWASMVKDLATTSIILFGGYNGAGALNDTWQLVGSTWTQLTPATSPPARYLAAMAYDPGTTSIILNGGFGSALLADTWSWNGTTWTQLTPATSPPARYAHSLAFETGSTLLLFGGLTASAYLNDTWTWNGTTWAQQAAPLASPSLRYAAQAIWDVGHGYMILFGGVSTTSTFLGDTWKWDGAAWTLLAPAAHPTARAFGACAYNTSTSAPTILGGEGSSYFSDMWTWSGTNWVQVVPATLPTARGLGGMSVGAGSQELVLFGGINSSGTLLNDTWTYNGTTWAQQAPAISPTARDYHTMVYDSSLNAPVIYGGEPGGGAYELGDLWEWTGTNWSALNPPTIPPARAGHVAVWDTALTAMLVFGGTHTNTYLADTWLLNAGNASLALPLTLTTCTSLTAPYLGLPVTAGEQIVLSGYFRPYPAATPTTRSFYLQLDWYGANGVLLSSTTGSSFAESASTWVQASVAGTAPTGALTVGRSIYSTGTISGDLHLFDAEQVEINTAPTSWEPPRDIKVNLFPIRQNLVPNPAGLGGTFGWAISSPHTFASSQTQAIIWPATTTSGWILTAGSTSAITFSTTPSIPVNPGVAYTFSMYARPVSGTPRNVQVLVQWYTSLGAFISSTTSPSFLETSGAFIRPYVLSTAPATAATAVVQLVVLAPANAQQHYVAAALLEPQGYLRPYFDANFSPYTDYTFEGNPNQSVSDYYPNLLSNLTRLTTALVDYVPIGSTFSLVIGSAALANSSLVG